MTESDKKHSPLAEAHLNPGSGIDSTRLDLRGVILSAEPQLRVRARRLVRSASDVDDLVQETIARALAIHDRFTPGTNVEPWLARIMMNLLIDRYRRDTRRAMSLEELPPEAEAAPEAEPIRIWDVLTSADVEAALLRIPKALTDVYTMHVLQGLSYRQIATRLDVPVATIGTRLLRARQRLRLELSARPSDPRSDKASG